MKTLEIERKGGVAWVWLNRAHRLNAMNETMLDELQETFATLSQDNSVGAIILGGRGRAFSSGFDITWMADLTPDMVRANRSHLRTIFDVIEQCPQPLISVVHGDALGGGLILILVSDFVLASESARFGAPEVKIGIFPSLGLVPRLERAVGIRAAKQLVLTGNAVDARTAHRIGLATEVVPISTLFDVAQTLADALAVLPTPATQAAKASFVAHRLPDYVEWEAQKATECWASAERSTTMSAFLSRNRQRDNPEDSDPRG